MERSGTEFKVGLTVLLALVIFVGGLLWLKGFRLRTSRYTVQVMFPNVGTLDVGDPASVSGVTKGEVAAIDLQGGEVIVGLYMSNDVSLRSDATFTIRNIGLMGQRFVDVRTGYSPHPLPLDVPADGFYDTGLPDVMGAMGRMTEEVRDLIHAVRSTIGSDTALAKIQAISASLERVTSQTAELIEEHQDAVSQTVEDLRGAAGSLRRTLQENEGRIARTVDRFDSAAVRLGLFAARMDTLSGQVRDVVDELRTGDGTLPRLIHDDQLLRRWEATADELDALVGDIRDHPGKYLKVKVSLF